MYPAASVPSEDQEVEVLAKAKRRNFTKEYKLGVLREADRCRAPGEVGALLRREGLYSSQLYRWRLARERGELAGRGTRKRGPRAMPVDERDKRIAQLERDKRKLEARLARAEGLIEAQKKIADLFGTQRTQTDQESESS
jgi:transposase